MIDLIRYKRHPESVDRNAKQDRSAEIEVGKSAQDGRREVSRSAPSGAKNRVTKKWSAHAALAGTVLLIGANVSMAQSAVTIYGTIDASVGETRDGKTNLKRLDSGAGSGTRLGFRGSEDLGDGLRAIFLLEMGFAVDTGTLQQGGAAFGRQSYVGLAGRNWSVTAGRHYAPVELSMVFADVFAQAYWGNTSGTGNGATSPASTLAGDGGQGVSARISNSVLGLYTLGPVTGRLMVSAGDESSIGGGHFWSPSLTYSAGPLLATIGYSRFRQYLKDIPTATSATWQYEEVAGATYDFDFVKLYAGYYKFDPAEANKVVGAATVLSTRSFWLGAKAPFGLHAVSAQVMDTKSTYIGPAGKGLTLGLVYEYNMSKRTRLYANYGQVNNNSAGRVSLVGGTTFVSPAAAGADPKALSLGIQHSF